MSQARSRGSRSPIPEDSSGIDVPGFPGFLSPQRSFGSNNSDSFTHDQLSAGKVSMCPFCLGYTQSDIMDGHIRSRCAYRIVKCVGCHVAMTAKACLAHRGLCEGNGTTFAEVLPVEPEIHEETKQKSKGGTPVVSSHVAYSEDVSPLKSSRSAILKKEHVFRQEEVASTVDYGELEEQERLLRVLSARVESIEKERSPSPPQHGWQGGHNPQSMALLAELRHRLRVLENDHNELERDIRAASPEPPIRYETSEMRVESF